MMAAIKITLVVVDALRLDYARSRLLAYQRLQKSGAEYLFHRSTNSWTYPALGTIHSGRMAADHGVMMWDESYGARPVLQADITLGEALQRLGFYTLACGTEGWGSSRFGWARGFHEFNNGMCQVRGDGLRMLHRFIKAEEAGHDRVFGFLHLLDIHDWPDLTQLTAREWKNKNRDKKLTAEDKTLALNCYEDMLDRTNPKLLDVVEALEPGPRSMVILTADHGESFWEYGPNIFSHEMTHHPPELMDLPLVIAGGDVRQGVQFHRRSFDYDLMPTIVQAAARMVGQEIALPKSIEGVDLMSPEGMAMRPEVFPTSSEPEKPEPMSDEEKAAVTQTLKDMGYM